MFQPPNKLVIDKKLDEMFAELQKAPPIYRPSKFWEQLNSIHIQQLSKDGFDDFKRSVNLRYFNWGILGIFWHQLSPVFSELMRGNITPFFRTDFVNYKSQSGKTLKSFDFISAWIYKTYVATLFDYVSRSDELNILRDIDEPLIGNPFVIKYKDMSTSQDLCNSVHEFYSSAEKLDYQKANHIAELGAGYGRLAYVFLKTLPKASYCIIDIPPALYMAQEYLSKIFHKEKIFYYRPFKSFAEIKEEFDSSRIKFIMPHQIEHLPDSSFNMFINISSLHEMTRAQISNYLKHIDRLTTGYFYCKQWQKSRTEDNSFIRENEYPIPRNWETIYKHRHPIQRKFFEALYRVG